MNQFKTYNPLVNLIFFVFVTVFSCFFMHPVCLGMSFVCSLIFSFIIKGRSAFKTNIVYVLPLLVVTAMINPLFNHQGETILWYLPGGSPITAESVGYGIGAAVMVATVINWFSCFNEIMTSDKLIYLFGKVMPSLSLVFSMTLRFVPRFAKQMKAVINARKALGKDWTSGSIIKRVQNGMEVLSVMISWSLENTIETADSMKARGYGIPGRTAFSVFRFEKRDYETLIFLALAGGYIIAGGIFGGMSFSYFPGFVWTKWGTFNTSVFITYFIFCFYPVFIELCEVIRWKYLISKM